ncbi:Hypothetical predicted protein [Paramuricea clavata]|uniref:Uncharacterized protein n=1 Tax=Paramuricea clavata TaxID=317549 RepID=A0A7D9HPD8_PARCT|nr:Hypothetical predicted protein [Paramuricea clavata]
MAESLDESDHLLVLEDYFDDEELDISFSNMSIDDVPPRSSTPKECVLQEPNVEESPIGEKHHLTPSSKQSLPKPKRFNVGGKPSGYEVTCRKKDLEMLLKQSFELKEGSEITVESLLSWLGFEHDKKVLLSRHIKDFFPGVYTRRVNKGGHEQYPFYYSV